MTSETLRLLITGDSDGAVQAFKKVGAAADKDLGKAEDKSAKTSAQLTKMGAASLAAGAVMVTALATTIGPASDLNEAINVVGLTFGDAKDEMVEWGKNAAKSTGLAADAALSGAAAIGGLLKNMGFMQDETVGLSKDLVVLAADMGSAFNMSTTEALEAIRSGLMGQSEPLRKFNVFLSDAAIKSKALEDGIWDGVGAMDEQEKTLARLAIITEQTADIQGDFANTNTDTAGAAKVAAAEFRNMQAAIGTELLPIVTEVLGVFNSLLGAFNGLSDPIKSAIGQAAIYTTGLLLLGGAALSVAGRVSALTAAVVKLTGSKKAAAAGGGILTAAVLLGAEAWRQHNDRVAQAEARIEGMKAALESAMGPQDAALQWLQEYASENDDLSQVLAGLTSAELREYAGAIAGTGELSEETGKKIADLAGGQTLIAVATAKMTEEFAKANEQVARQAEIADIASGKNAEAARIYGEMASGMRNATGAADGLGGSINRMEPTAKTLSEVLGDINSELSEFFGSIQSAEEAEADFQKAIDDASDSIQENGARLGTNTERQRANLAARGRVIDSIDGMVKSMMEEKRSSAEIVAKTREMVAGYEATMLAATGSETKARDLTAALDDIPDEVEATLELLGYDLVTEQIANSIRLAESYERVWTATLATRTTSSGGGTTTADDEGLPEDWVPASRSARKSRSFRSTGMDKNEGSSPTHITLVMPDGKVLADVVVQESERRGGLPLLVRPGR
jgi:hypothetical protein